MIFTFYSFKGGVGRSMTLANVGEVFYARGLKVLMIDFDLEAPGLERYFDVKNSATPSGEIPGRNGVIDLILSFLELQSFAPKLPPAAAPEGGGQSTFPFSVEPLKNFIVPIYDDPARSAKLSMMPSGNRFKPDFAAYTKRVLDFDWARFYTEKDGERFFEWFRLELERDWDVVLIDSRTGVTELGGVCTHHLADAVISFVATNQQNLDGAVMMARSLANKKLVKEGRKGRKLDQLFVPSRVELSEEDKHDEFASQFNARLGSYFPETQAPEQGWFLDLRLFYVPAYSYMERVAVREPERASKADLIQAYGRLAARMASMAESGPLFEAWAPPSRTLSNLPPRNPYIAGREEDLKRIRLLMPTGTPVAICGLGGVGKTTLAIEYAYRYRSEHSATLLCPARTEDEMRRGCEELMRLFAIETSDAPPRDAVRGWLGSNDGWLLILDDVQDPALARSLLPTNIRGTVLYTTRSQQVSALGAQPVSLESISREASVGFFEKRLGQREWGEAERAAAAELVDEVGALPLALEQSAAYIANRGTRVQDYLASFRKRRLGLLDQQVVFGAGRELSVTAAFEPALEEVEKDVASADVLRVASFLDCGPIPTALLVRGATELGEAIASALASAGDDPVAIDEVLDPLTRFSLIERNRESQAFSVHKLVADLVRARAKNAAMWQQRIASALNAAFPEPTWENTAICAALLPHVAAVLTWSTQPRLRLRAGQYMLIRGEYDRVEQYLAPDAPFSDSPEAVLADQFLARAYFAQSRVEEAIALLERGSALANTLRLGSEIRTTFLLNLAECHFALGHAAQAEKLYGDALADSRDRGDIPNVILSLCGLAGVLAGSNKDAAIAAAMEAVSCATGTALDLQAIAYGSLANVLVAGGRAMETRTLEVMQTALATAERAYGPQHPVLAGTLRMYAILLSANGREAEGQAVYRRAQEIIDRTLGAESPAATLFRSEYENLLASARSADGVAGSIVAKDPSSIAPMQTEVASPGTGSAFVPKKEGQSQEVGDGAVSFWTKLFGHPSNQNRKLPKILYLGAAIVLIAAAAILYIEIQKMRHRDLTPPGPAITPSVNSSGGVNAPANGGQAANPPPRQNVPTEWGIEVSEDTTLEPLSPGGPSAEWEPVRASRAGYRTAAVFQQGTNFLTIIEEPDQQAAKAALQKIKKNPPYDYWGGATMSHIGEWCSNAAFARKVQVAEVAVNVYDCKSGPAK